MLIIDLTFCGDNGDGRVYHGGSDYALSAMRFFEKYFKGEIVLLMDHNMSPEKLGIGRSEFQIIYSRNMGLPTEFDSSGNIFFIPIPYFYIENSLLPKRARVWATVHGLRHLELSRLAAQMLPVSSPNDVARETRAYKILRHGKKYLQAGNQYERELKKIELYKNFLTKGHRVLTVSEHSKWTLELLGVTGTPAEPIQVAYPLHPFDSVFESETAVPTEKKGLLFLSGERREKNIQKLIEAVNAFPKLEREIREQGMSITGEYCEITKISRMLPDVPVKNFGYCSASELNALFKTSRLLIYPSVSEGFGIPPVQALRYGLPVLASPTTSIAEILGDAAVYCNPFDAGEIAVRILMMLNCPELLSMKASKGKKRYEMLKEQAHIDWHRFLLTEGVQKALCAEAMRGQA